MGSQQHHLCLPAAPHASRLVSPPAPASAVFPASSAASFPSIFSSPLSLERTNITSLQAKSRDRRGRHEGLPVRGIPARSPHAMPGLLSCFHRRQSTFRSTACGTPTATITAGLPSGAARGNRGNASSPRALPARLWAAWPRRCRPPSSASLPGHAPPAVVIGWRAPVPAHCGEEAGVT